MSTVFGDFVFKITAPVRDAIRNIQMWDKEMTVAMKNAEKEAKEQSKNMTFLQKTWQGFSKTAAIAFTALTAAVMRWSPHIRAHLSIIGLHMRMLARDIGETWAPAFKLANKLFGDFVKTWREWGTVSKTASEEAGTAGGLLGSLGLSEKDVENFKKGVHDIVNTALGIGAAITAFFALGKVLTWIFGSGPITTAISGFAATVGGALMGALGWIALILAGIIVFAVTFKDAWDENFLGIQETMRFVWDAIKEIFQGAIDFIVGIWEIAVGFLTGDTDKVVEGLTKAWEGLQKMFWGVGKAIWGIMMALVAWFIKFSLNVMTVVIELGIKIWDWAKEAFGNVWNKITEIWTGIKNTISEVAGNIWDAIVEKFGAIINFFTEFKNNAGTVFSEMWSNITNTFSSMLTNAYNWGRDFIDNIWRGIESMGSWFREKVEDAFGWISDVFSFDSYSNDLLARKWGKDMVANFAEGSREEGQTIINQRIASNVTVNNTASNFDAYGVSNQIQGLLNSQFSRLKGLGSQYY